MINIKNALKMLVNDVRTTSCVTDCSVAVLASSVCAVYIFLCILLISIHIASFFLAIKHDAVTVYAPGHPHVL